MTVREVRVPVATVWASPDAPRDVDRAAVLDLPDVPAWAAAMDAATRKGLGGRTLTQLLLGEPVRVLEDRGDWVRVAALWQASSEHATGYPGWVRSAHLGAAVPRSQGATAFVLAASTALETGGIRTNVSFGTALWVESVAEQSATVLLPDDRTGTLALSDVRLADKGQRPLHGSGDVLDLARQFLGLRYLWGGNSCWGLDCSGLVHLVHRALGVLVPRDAHDQAQDVDPVALDQVLPGDLYFFARPGDRVYHVGFATRPFTGTGQRWMLHAPEGAELVEDAPMAPHRLEHLVSAGRVRRDDRPTRHPG
jgi:gamma-D-glutamyl-L-lysine dipeptidyl-peptidase